MKTFITAGALIVISLTAFGQWDTSSSPKISYNLGNVGIGTSSPDYLLQLHGSSTPTLAIGKSNQNTNGKSSLVFFAGDGTAANGFFINYFKTTATDRLGFVDGGGIEGLTLKNGGNVGIGTITPTSKLHVAQSSNTDWAATISNGGGSGKGLYIKSAGGTSTPALQIDDNIGVNRLMVLSNGKIGIGASSPGANLQIGQSTINGLLSLGGYSHVGCLKSSGDFFAGMNSYAEYTSSDDNKIKVLSSNAYGFSAMQMSYNGNINFYTKAGSVTANDQINVSSNAQLTILGNGNVGIGTTSPDAKLAVKGTIHTQEVKVDLNGAVAPDYVFEPDYKLLSLEEIKSYIEKNKHLPEVPSAKEMETNGVNVSEMNMLLLKKIEELTLHVIELKKENRELNERVSKIENHN